MQLCNGVLCGLVAVTPGCGLIDPWAAMIVAVLGSATFLGLDYLMLKLLLDDVVAAAPMHLGCGVVGTLFVGLFARENYINEFYGVNPAGEDSTVHCIYGYITVGSVGCNAFRILGRRVFATVGAGAPRVVMRKIKTLLMSLTD
jgi:Amt family ammonium transporter